MYEKDELEKGFYSVLYKDCKFDFVEKIKWYDML